MTSGTGTVISGVTSPYTHTGRTNGTAYYYIVVAKNASGTSSDSSEDGATPLAAPSITVTDGNTQNSVTWSGVTGASSYDLYWNTTGSPTSSDNVIAGVTSTYNHTGRTNGTTYYYRMVAKNAGGDVSSLSSEDSGTPNAPPTISLNSTSGFLVSSGSNPYTLEIYEGQAAVITFNIADADGGDSPYAYCASLPSWASIGGHPDTTMDITPDLGDSATGSFTCQASDGKDTSSTTLTFNYTVKVPVIASSDSVASTQTSTTAYDEAMGRAAASNNGHRLVIYPEVAHAGLLYCRWDGSDWDDCGELTDTNRYIYDTSNNTTKHFNIAAGDDGNFVVCWVDTATTGTTTGTDAKLKVKRFLSGSWEGFIVPTYQLLIFL